MISIIFPTLNEEAFLDETLRGLNSMLTLPHEIIISDGKSTDKTVEIARRLNAKVVEYTGEARQTIAMGRNAGAAAATGDFYVFMDADCHLFNPDRFFKIALEYFDKHPESVALTVSIRVYPESETIADMVVFIIFNSYLQLMNNVFNLGIAAGEFQMIRADAFKKIGGYNDKLVASEDVDLFFRLSHIGHIGFLHKLKVFHSGRRAHKVGWPKLISIWIGNTLSMWTRGRAMSKEWSVIR